MKSKKAPYMTLLVCIIFVVFGMPLLAIATDNVIPEFEGLPFGTAQEKLDDWLQSNMISGYSYLEG